ncbi:MULTISPECIES: lactate utilization protein C [unclassified Streptomyces]|uniref:LutC/YkgG family protein n=1 Tax=unclassified Streptomyces TaxID=2593676 RepID=UPI0016602BD3|nr:MULTISPECIES: lactate utilization protein C [unclassified Streptomyces]MBD0708237.1 lactate utilization protein C [Streptomyces sp. CBMA291]MBD0717806.1 lactate utilization protein C [Streptomyces sp. CBMA370]
MTASPGDSRARVLARIRAAVADAPEAPDVPRAYRVRHGTEDAGALLDLLHENLADYRAHVHRTTPDELPALIALLLAERGARAVVVPPGLPPRWLAATDAERLADDPRLTPYALDGADAVVTGCALAIAETGTIILDGGPGQGRRALTLVPDLHLCVVRAPEQVVASVPEALPRLAPERPLTWISGPSATSDIELDRVEGVHGPRTLDVILVTDGE